MSYSNIKVQKLYYKIKICKVKSLASFFMALSFIINITRLIFTTNAGKKIMLLNFDRLNRLALLPLSNLKDKILPSLAAAALGVFLLFGAGFAEMSPLHNAAHDARHAAGFPCH